MSIGKIATKAAQATSGAVGDLMSGGRMNPDTDYALAAWLFEKIDANLGPDAERSREYYLELMRDCLAAVRQGAPRSGDV